jgi:cell division protein FtsB
MILFAYIYLFGPHGMRVLMDIEQEDAQLNSEITQVQMRVNTLQTTITQWNIHPFYKEKIAREQLQMARKNDEIYYIS